MTLTKERATKCKELMVIKRPSNVDGLHFHTIRVEIHDVMSILAVPEYPLRIRVRTMTMKTMWQQQHLLSQGH